MSVKVNNNTDESYEQEPGWMDDLSSDIHRIRVSKPSDGDGEYSRMVWLLVVEDESFEDATMMIDITDEMDREMDGDRSQYRK